MVNQTTFNYNKITLSGFAGAGKTVLGKKLADHLDCKFISIGNFTRDYAKKVYNMDIYQFQEYIKDKPNIDIRLDSSFSDKCSLHSRLIIDWRLGFHFIKNSFNIFLHVSEETAAQRLKNDHRKAEFKNNDLEFILQQSRNRNNRMRERFIDLYNIDFANESYYDLVLETDNLSIQDELDLILKKLKG
jgi:predicted cytidylate kinase